MATTTAAASARQMAEASSRFLDSLSPDQKAKATFDYLDGERIFWYYPPMNRHGLALRDMEPGQQELAYAVMASGLTADSYQKAKLIIEHEAVLGPLEKEQGTVTFVRDPELYYFTVFGDPSGADPWGWRVEGHHVSLHFSIWGGKVISMTPFFFGANPAEVRSGPKSGLRILGARQDMALELMASLDAGQRSKALLYDEAPYDILTYNSSKAVFPREQGLKAAKMSETQKGMLKTLVAEYVNQVRSDLAEQKLAELEEEGYDRLHWAWAGPAKAGEKHYYRIHGGNFVIEYDNRQNDANHIHSVWRDVQNDFASDVMREHLLMYHVL